MKVHFCLWTLMLRSLDGRQLQLFSRHLPEDMRAQEY